MSDENIVRERASSFVAEVWNQRRYSLIPEIMKDPVLLHIKGHDINSSHDHFRSVVDKWHERYTGFHFDTDANIVDGEMAVLLLTLHGLPKDEGENIPVSVRHVFILRFEGGIVVEAWEFNDFPG